MPQPPQLYLSDVRLEQVPPQTSTASVGQQVPKRQFGAQSGQTAHDSPQLHGELGSTQLAPSQLMNPGLQCQLQIPSLQSAVALAGASHGVQLKPQVRGLVLSEQVTVSHEWNPSLQTIVQFRPSSQRASPFSGTEQVTQAGPQWAASVNAKQSSSQTWLSISVHPDGRQMERAQTLPSAVQSRKFGPHAVASWVGSTQALLRNTNG